MPTLFQSTFSGCYRDNYLREVKVYFTTGFNKRVRQRIPIWFAAFVIFLCHVSVASAQMIVSDESGHVFARAGSQDSQNVASPTSEANTMSALAGVPLDYVGAFKQYENYSDFNYFNGIELEENQAYLTWWGVGHHYEIMAQGNVGDTFRTRIISPSGTSYSGRWVWNDSSECWQNQSAPDDPLWCLNVGDGWVSAVPSLVVGTYASQIYVNDELVSNSQKSYEVIGMSLDRVGSDSLSGRAGTTISQPLEVKVVDYNGVSGAPGQIVRFRFSTTPSSGFGLVSTYTSPSTGAGSSYIDVTTNSDGIARAFVELGNQSATYSVVATSSAAPIDPPRHSANPVFSVTAGVTELSDIDIEKNQGGVNGAANQPCITVGNPVNVATGNKFQKEEDIAGVSAFPLEFIRYYNLTDLTSRSLGENWRHTYDRELTITRVGKGKNAVYYARIKRPDGKGFTLTDNGNGFVGDSDIDYSLNKTSGKWHLRTDEDMWEIYNSKGRLLSIEDGKGNVQTLDYDNQNLLTEVTTNSNESLIFEYDDAGFLTNVEYWASNPSPTMLQGRSWHFGYTDSRLTSVTNPDGTQRQYHYEDPYFPYALTGITDERGIRYATYEYDEKGISASTLHGLGTGRVDIEYGVNGERTVTDSLGNVTVYKAVSQLGVGKVSEALGPTCSTGDNSVAQYSYDPSTGDLLTKTINGVTTEYGDYDSNGNPGYMIEAVGTPFERRTSYTYDPRFHRKITSITEPSVVPGSNKVTSRSYDEGGNLLTDTVRGFRPDGTAILRSTRYEYNGPFGQLSMVDGPRTDVSDITTYEYYGDDADLYQYQGMLRRVVGPGGIILRDNLQYNEARQLISETRPNGMIINYEWEPNTNRLIAMTETDGIASRVTRWTHLPTGEIETVIFPDGTSLTYSYDDSRRLTRITDHQNNYIEYTLDAEGNVLNESVFDSKNTLQRSIARSFDAYNRLDQLVKANELIDYDFASDGTLARQFNGNGVRTDYGYDELKRLVLIENDSRGNDPATANTTVGHGYDSQDNLVSVTDPEANETQYVHDDLGNLVNVTSPDTGMTSYRYDAAGNRIQSIDAKSQVFTYSYDALNRLVSRDAPGTGHDLQYHYDNCINGLGKLCNLVRGPNQTVFTYNGFGEVARKTELVATSAANVSASVDFVYDMAGRIQNITYPGGTSVTYGYDELGNMNQLQLDRGGLLTDVISNTTYKPFGPLASMTFGNGISRMLDYDNAYRLTTISDAVYDAVLSYDANGNISYQSRTGGDLSASYDALDRLTDVEGPLGVQSYEYDRNANRTKLTDNGTSAIYGYSPLSNRLAEINGETVALDENGNTTYLQGLNMEYSPDNRLRSVTGIAEYGYNGLGERVRKSTNTEETVYLYGRDGQLMAEIDQTGQIKTAYLWFNGQPVGVLDNLHTSTSELYYIHTDHLGTPQTLTNETGTLVWSADYKPFGLAAINEDPDLDGIAIELNLRFPGQYFDKETGLHYNYFRDYDPSTGRYVQSDPIGLDGGINTYAYVENNPLIFADPFGLHHTENGGTARCAYNDFDCAAGLAPDTPERTKRRECFVRCIVVGEGTSAVRNRAIEMGLEEVYGRGARIIWRRMQTAVGPLSWAYSIYSCNDECDEDCES